MQLRRLRTGPLTVDPDRAIAHINRCLAWGMRYDAWDSVGVGHVDAIIRGERAQILRSTEERILALTPQPGVNCSPAYSAARRLQALVALGHPQRQLAEQLGVMESYLSMFINNTRGWQQISKELWQQISELYEHMSARPGHSTAARNRAAAKGWPPPLAWDDIDDPEAKPAGKRRSHKAKPMAVDESRVLRFLSGEDTISVNRAEKEEIMRRWLASGRSERELCKRMGWREGRYTVRRDGAA